ncbi:MAG: arginase family protein [Anaerolineae bacterium]|uniref:arginase family protein n=1 Tax=Promineifilum sp. TaxID=2664178 RepID=UPI001D99862D|nr:arginase family protein [Anaerolineales bacterium]MCB8936058.1 arginase family protein [Promineifilum sp.]MCO5181678.1 arginase family protein [Promineifilum sp.]MCW5847785.1 arginase family protein [Anaerolineae bacterium]
MNDRFILSPYFLDEYKPAVAALAADDWRVVWAELPPGETTARMGALYHALAADVRAVVDAGERPVTIAGDCCATIGMMAGLQQSGAQPTLIWLDAHGDFNTPETTPSGFLGGMPLAMAVGLGDQTLLVSAGMRPWPASRVILSDARDLDPGERINIARAGITYLPHVEQLLDPGRLPSGPLYVHFDADVIDPAEAPAMNYPAPDGPSSETVRHVLRALAATGRVAAVSVSLWEPALDPDGLTQAVVQGALNALLGR